MIASPSWPATGMKPPDDPGRTLRASGGSVDHALPQKRDAIARSGLAAADISRFTRAIQRRNSFL